MKFVDVRKPEDYKKGHIPGAVNLPVHDNFTSETLSAIVKKNEKVVFYCNGVRCQASSIAAKKSTGLGLEKRLLLPGRFSCLETVRTGG